MDIEVKQAMIAAKVIQTLEEILTGEKALVIRTQGKLDYDRHTKEDYILNMETSFHIVEVVK